MNFSIRTLGFLVLWMSVVMALLMFAKSEANPNNTYPVGFASELLLTANFAFFLVAFSFAIGAVRSRFWIASAAVSAIFVSFQVYECSANWAVSAVAEKLFKLLVVDSSETYDANWMQNHTSEFTKLLTYSWTPVISLACGCLAKWKEKQSEPDAGWQRNAR
jgi:hypothetical protein